MQMPFGKHKGEELDDIPVSYLRWILRNVPLTSDELREEIEEIVGEEASAPADSDGSRWSRRANGTATADPTRSNPSVDLQAMQRELIDAVNRWRRAMAGRHHPDRGGDAAVMTAINDAGDKLLKEIDGFFTRRA